MNITINSVVGAQYRLLRNSLALTKMIEIFSLWSWVKNWNVDSKNKTTMKLNIAEKCCVILEKNHSVLTVNHKIVSLAATKLSIDFPNVLCCFATLRLLSLWEIKKNTTLLQILGSP